MSSEVVISANELPPAVIEAIRAGHKIEAIRLLRESENLGLANAKVLVESAWRTHGPARQYVSFEDQPRGLSRLGKSLAMLLAATAAWYFYYGS